MKGLIRFEFRLPALVKKKRTWYISSCPALEVFSQGKNKKEALANLEEALRLFIESCYERGTLGQVLRQSGFEAATSVKELRSKPKQEYVDVPLSLLAHSHAEARAH